MSLAFFSGERQTGRQTLAILTPPATCLGRSGNHRETHKSGRGIQGRLPLGSSHPGVGGKVCGNEVAAQDIEGVAEKVKGDRGARQRGWEKRQEGGRQTEPRAPKGFWGRRH